MNDSTPGSETQEEMVRRKFLVRASGIMAAPLAVMIGYTGDAGDVIGVDRFGASAPGPVVMREYGFSVERVCHRARALLERRDV